LLDMRILDPPDDTLKELDPWSVEEVIRAQV
jgi:hypothetical protein